MQFNNLLPLVIGNTLRLSPGELAIEHSTAPSELRVNAFFVQTPQQWLEAGFSFVIAIRKQRDAIVAGRAGKPNNLLNLSLRCLVAAKPNRRHIQ